MTTPFPVSSDADIESAILSSSGRMDALARASDPFGHNLPLVIKYMSVASARHYRAGKANQLSISNTIGYTWGTGTYVTPLAFPTSSAIFGRLGVVARFDPTHWRVFDAVDPKHQDLYLSWTWRQPLYHRLSMLSKGSALYNQYLRDRFRSHFRIDCVLFPPDQVNKEYTNPTDVWMCVTDWRSRFRIAEGLSKRFTFPKACVLVDEEFCDINAGTERDACLNPGGRTPTNDVLVAEQIAQRYFTKGDWVRVEA